VLGAAFGPQIILVLLWKRASYAGAVAGMLVGFIVPLVWKNVYFGPSDTEPASALYTALGGVEIYNLPLAFVLALFVNTGVSLLSSRPSDARAVRR
jgi:Na+/proline symporter